MIQLQGTLYDVESEALLMYHVRDSSFCFVSCLEKL